MSIVSVLTHCRICKSDDLVNVIDLGEQVITSRFPTYGDFSTPKTSIVLCMCRQCSLIQLRETTDSSELYEHEYGYRSGISNTMRSHLKAYQEEILSKVDMHPGDIHKNSNVNFIKHNWVVFNLYFLVFSFDAFC